MSSFINDIKSSDIKKYSSEDFSTAFNIIKNSNNNTNDLSTKIGVLVSTILELSEKLELKTTSDNFQKRLIDKLTKSEDLKYIWIWELVSNIIYWEKIRCLENKKCHDIYETEKFSKEINFVWDIEEWWKVIKVSKNIENILWYTSYDFKEWNLNFSEIIHPDDLERVFKEVEEHSIKKDSTFIQEYRVKKKNWEIIVVKDRTIVKFDEKWNIKYFYWYIYDITEQVEMEKHIRQNAYFDQKTWLPNDIQLQEDIEKIKWNKMVVLLKVNQFKHINTTYGFRAWDKILISIKDELEQKFSEIWFRLYKTWQLNFWLLKQCSSNSDKSNTSLTKTEREITIEKISSIIKNFTIDTDYWKMGIKLSAWSACMRNATFDDALHALYSWYNSWILTKFSDTLEKEIKLESENKIKWSKKIKEWLEKWYFIPYYQWIRDNERKHISKYEALVRYNDWKQIYSPFHFLKIADNLNLLSNISRRMIDVVLDEMSRHNNNISINLTERDFLNESIIKIIENKLKQYNIQPSRLTIEVLENITEEWNKIIIENIKKLQKLWIKISIDDFGTGHSNFSRLLDVSPDFLKIDWSLIKWIIWKDSHKYWTILRSIIDFWHNQWAKIIAEYVENKEIQEKLDILWVDYSQWYYYSEPSRDIIEKKKELD